MSLLEKHIETNVIDKKLQELIKIRASQINRCTYWIKMHVRMPSKWLRPTATLCPDYLEGITFVDYIFRIKGLFL